MNYSSAPTSVRSLEQRIRNVESSDGLALRRRVGMALVVVGQMLPEGVVKGGSAMALRYGRGTRFTQDLDAARVQPLAEFRSDFEDSLAAGWAGFTGRLVEKAAPRPPAVPRAYVMQPFEVKLDYRGRSWCTVKFELGHNEIGDADEPEYQLAADLAGLFTEVGLPAPKAVPVMRSDHQVAQKLHAVTDEGSERARDLVDLQLLDKGANLDLAQVASTCMRLSTTGSSNHGRRPFWLLTSGRPSTPRPPKVSTSCRPWRRQSCGPTRSSDALRRPAGSALGVPGRPSMACLGRPRRLSRRRSTTFGNYPRSGRDPDDAAGAAFGVDHDVADERIVTGLREDQFDEAALGRREGQGLRAARAPRSARSGSTAAAIAAT